MIKCYAVERESVNFIKEIKLSRKNASLASVIGTTKDLYATYDRKLKLLFLSTLVAQVINISSKYLDISFKDEILMGAHAYSVIEEESVVMLKDSPIMIISRTDVNENKLAFYEEKYIIAFLITNYILTDEKQRKINLNKENITKTFERLYSRMK